MIVPICSVNQEILLSNSQCLGDEPVLQWKNQRAKSATAAKYMKNKEDAE